MKKAVFIFALALPQSPVVAAPMTTPGKPIAIACTGPLASAARKVAVKNSIQSGMHPNACFGKIQIYDGPNFEKPVCGSTVSIGPRNQWGDWMLTVDGRRYGSRGQYYVPMP